MTKPDDTKGYERCGAKGRTGKLCGLPAGHGTDHVGIGRCRRHGGSTPSHELAAAKELARRGCQQLGVPVEIHPAISLLEEVFRAQGVVDYLGALVAELPTHPVPAKKTEKIGGADDGATEWEPPKPGVYGPTYHVSGRATGEAKPHVLYTLWLEERKHLAKVNALALQANIAAERVKLERDQAKLIADGFRQFAIALGHDPAAPEVREAFRGQLKLIAGGR